MSAVNDPNDYAGPGTGLPDVSGAAGGDRRHSRRARRREVLRSEATFARDEARRIRYRDMGRPRSAATCRGGGRRQPGIRREVVSHTGRPSAVARCSRAEGWGNRGRGLEAAGGALRAHGRHIFSRPVGGRLCRLGRRYRAPGEGHGGHPPARTGCRTTISSCSPTRRSPGSSIIARLGANAAALCAGRDAGAGRGADARRGDGRALSCRAWR